MFALLKKDFFFLPRSFFTVLFLLVIQQLIVGSSSIWITQLISHINDGPILLYWLALYISSLLLPYIPGAFILIQLTKTQVEATVKYIQKFIDIYPNQILQWTDLSEQNKKLSIMTGESTETIRDYIEYLYHILSSSLNVIISLLMIAIIIDYSILVFYVIGVCMSAIILYVQKKHKTFLSSEAQQGRINWTGLLLKSWDNILLNNKYTSQRWREKFVKKSTKLIDTSVLLEKFNQFISISMAIVLMAPTFLYLAYLAYQRIYDPVWLAMLTVILPRLFQSLSYSYELLFLFSNFPMQTLNLNTVLSLIDQKNLLNVQEELQNLERRINFGKITIFQSPEGNALDLIKTLPAIGRITLKGDNGSGKTSLLLLIKKQHNESAFYLPAKHELLFKLSQQYFSTGEMTKKILHEIRENVTSPIILLDEWDANLDKNTKNEMSILIDDLASRFCIIESRHNFAEHEV